MGMKQKKGKKSDIKSLNGDLTKKRTIDLVKKKGKIRKKAKKEAKK